MTTSSVHNADPAAAMPEGDQYSTHLRRWAVTTTESWSQQVQKEWRRQKRIETSARYRAAKKLELQQLRDEQNRLVDEVKRSVAQLFHAASSQEAGISSDEKVVRIQVRRLAIESDALSKENVELRRAFQHHERFWDLARQTILNAAALPRKQALEGGTQRLWQSQLNKSGWRVYFPNSEPSLYYGPYSREEAERVSNPFDPDFRADLPSTFIERSLFGWKVRRALILADHSQTKLQMPYMQYTKRMHPSIERTIKISIKREKTSVRCLLCLSDGRVLLRQCYHSSATRVQS